jgi:hypothetical protein
VTSCRDRCIDIEQVTNFGIYGGSRKKLLPMGGFTCLTSNNGIEFCFILLEGAGRKGGAYSVSSSQAEDKDIANGNKGKRKHGDFSP